jgi:hypothetical protein
MNENYLPSGVGKPVVKQEEARGFKFLRCMHGTNTWKTECAKGTKTLEMWYATIPGGCGTTRRLNNDIRPCIHTSNLPINITRNFILFVVFFIVIMIIILCLLSLPLLRTCNWLPNVYVTVRQSYRI